MTRQGNKRRKDPVPETMHESGIWVFESRHDESFFMKPTQHRFPKLLCIRDGGGEIHADWPGGSQNLMACSSGDCFLVPARMRHRIVDDQRSPISLYGLAVDPRKVSPCKELEALIPPGRLPRQRVELLDIERRIRRLLYLIAKEGPASMLSAVAGAIDVFAKLALASEMRGDRENATDEITSPPTNDSLDAIDEYLRWLDTNFFEQLTVDAAARACGMSRRKFTQDFRTRTNKTWLVYVNELRIQHAIGLLENTDSKVTSIAFQSGFEELSTFYRVFKRLTGGQPLDFRDPTENNCRS